MLNGKTYLLDRLPFLLIYVINVALTLTVVNLGVLQRGMSLSWGDNGYIALLSLFLLSLWLGIGYARRRSFYRQVRESWDALSHRHGEGLEEVLRIQSAADREQEALRQLLHAHYRAHAEELLQLRQQADRHHIFINQWVHQMKTPVAVIDLLLQQAEEEPLPSGIRERMASLAEENDRIAQGLSMILHTARLDRFEMDVQIRRIELIGFLRRIINVYKKTWIRHALYPKLETDLAEVYVESDEKWLGFMLHQLISNAVKYSALADREGSKRLLFAVRKGEGGIIMLRIEDEGIGIPARDLPRIFDPFFTGDNGRLTKESTGMGLYIAKQVSGKLGHGLEAESAQGEGAAVTLAFRPRAGLHAVYDRE